MRIDKKEFIKQEKQEILDSGGYLHLEILIPKIEGTTANPITSLTGNGDSKMAFCMLRYMRIVEEELYSNDPRLLLLMLKSETDPNFKEKTINLNKLDEEIDDD